MQKAITIKQPWASLIVDGLKDIENRTWKTKFRGRVLVHSGMDNKWERLSISAMLTEEQFNLCFDNEFLEQEFPYGAIIGSVEIVDCVINHESIWAEKIKASDMLLYHIANTKPPVIYNWVLANPIKFDKPIYNVKGKLSFWDYEE